MRRWELERGLPVHRVPGSSRSSVFAFRSELEEWLRRPQSQPIELVDPQATQPSPIPIAEPVLDIAMPKADSPAPSRLLPWIVTGVLSVAVFAGVYSYRQTAHFNARAAGRRDAAQSSTRHIPTPEAQDLYLKGRFAWNQRTPESLNQAVDLFTQAIVHDANYAEAYVGLADCYNLLREFSVMSPNEAYPRAAAAARKAVELDPSSAEAHTSLAFALFWGNIDAAAGEREFKRALALDPKNTRAHHWYATYLLQIRRYPEALKEIDRARQLDSSSAAIMADKGLILVLSGQTNDGIALLKQVEASDPNFSETHRYLSGAYLDRGDVHSYFEEAATANRLTHDADGQFVLEEQKNGYAAAGIPGLHQATLRAHQKLYDQGRASDFTLAVDYAALNDKAEALQHLEKAYEKREPGMTSILGYPEFKNLREESRFKEIAAKVGLPWSP